MGTDAYSISLKYRKIILPDGKTAKAYLYPHRGSWNWYQGKESEADRIFKRVSPEYAIIPGSWDNDYAPVVGDVVYSNVRSATYLDCSEFEADKIGVVCEITKKGLVVAESTEWFSDKNKVSVVLSYDKRGVRTYAHPIPIQFTWNFTSEQKVSVVDGVRYDETRYRISEDPIEYADWDVIYAMCKKDAAKLLPARIEEERGKEQKKELLELRTELQLVEELIKSEKTRIMDAKESRHRLEKEQKRLQKEICKAE